MMLDGAPVKVGMTASVEVEVWVEVELDEDSDEGVGVGVGVEVLEGVGFEVSSGDSVGVGVAVEVLELVGRGVGVLVLVLDDVGMLDTGLLCGLESPLEEPLPSTSKTIMLPLRPGGTVTTQPVAPPAPVNTSSASMTLTSMEDGSILQGRPLQPSPSHSIEIPKFGRTLRKGVVGSR